MDLFSTRTMLKMLDQTPAPTTFLRDRYFSNVKTFGTKTVEIDIRNGAERVAPFVHPRIGGKLVDKSGYKTSIYEPAEVSPEMLTTAADMLNRLPGESQFTTMSPQERAAIQLAQDLAELDAMVDRREELMVAQALFDGKIVVSGDGYNGEEIKFWTGTNDPYVALNSTQQWSASTSNPLADLDAAKKRARKSGVNAVDVLMGQDVLDAFLSNSKIKEALDNRRIDRGEIRVQDLPGGVSYYGYIDGLDIWSYDGEYYDESTSTNKAFVDPKKLLVASPRAYTTMAYGAVALVNQDKKMIDIVEGRRVPYSHFSQKNPQGQVAQIKAKPLPIVHQIQAFQVIKALT